VPEEPGFALQPADGEPVTYPIDIDCGLTDAELDNVTLFRVTRVYNAMPPQGVDVWATADKELIAEFLDYFKNLRGELLDYPAPLPLGGHAVNVRCDYTAWDGVAAQKSITLNAENVYTWSDAEHQYGPIWEVPHRKPHDGRGLERAASAHGQGAITWAAPIGATPLFTSRCIYPCRQRPFAPA
jgi:hypothetical protein